MELNGPEGARRPVSSTLPEYLVKRSSLEIEICPCRRERRNQKEWLGRWNVIPLYVRIIVAMMLGLITGLVLGERAIVFEIPSQVILQLLGALAPPLILIAVTHVLMTTQISGKTAGRLALLLLLNTTVAILIGLSVANLVKPGTWSEFKKTPVDSCERNPEAFLRLSYSCRTSRKVSSARWATNRTLSV